MKTIAYYLRNITEIQDYEYQLQNLDKRFNQFKDLNKIVYAEKVSGFKSEKERPKMAELLQDVDNSLVNEIWVNDVTRLSRDAINMQIIVKHCQEKGVNIYFEEQNLNTLDSNGKADFTTTLLINILGQFSEANAKTLKSKLNQGKKTGARSGHFVGGVLPFGYKAIHNTEKKVHKIIIDENQRIVVEYIFNSYVNDGKSLNKIASELNNLANINPIYQTTFKSKKIGQNFKNIIWLGSTIKYLIECRWYAEGIRQFSGEEIILPTELKFIDLDVYNAAIAKLKTNRTLQKPHSHSYILNEKLYCSCGSKMLAKVNNAQKIYVCNVLVKRKTDKTINCLISKGIDIEKIENAVWLLVKNKLPEFRFEVETKLTKTVQINQKIENNNQLINSIQTKTIENLSIIRQRTIDNFNKFGGFPIDSKISEIDNQIKNEEKTILSLKSENKMLIYSIDNLDISNEIEDNLTIIENDKNLIKFYINKLINKITLCGNLKNTNQTALKIEWANQINNNNSTYLFYSNKNDGMYYFFNAETSNITIDWNLTDRTFKVTDSELNESISISIENTIKIIEMAYDIDVDTINPEYIINDFSLYRDVKELKSDEIEFMLTDYEKLNIQFSNKEDPFSAEIEESKLMEKMIYLLSSGKIEYKFIVSLGMGKLEIVSPFI